MFTCSQCSWALRLRWCSDCLNSTWIPDRKFLLTGQENGWRIIIVAPTRFTWQPVTSHTLTRLLGQMTEIWSSVITNEVKMHFSLWRRRVQAETECFGALWSLWVWLSLDVLLMCVDLWPPGWSPAWPSHPLSSHSADSGRFSPAGWCSSDWTASNDFLASSPKPHLSCNTQTHLSCNTQTHVHNWPHCPLPGDVFTWWCVHLVMCLCLLGDVFTWWCVHLVMCLRLPGDVFTWWCACVYLVMPM